MGAQKKNKPAKSNSNKVILEQKQLLLVKGILPAPEILAKYENILPGAAERILKLAENQSAHRQYIEKEIIKTNSRDSLLGLIFGFLICLITIIGGIYCILKGYNVGSFISITGLAGVVGAFVYGAKTLRDDLKNKSK